MSWLRERYAELYGERAFTDYRRMLEEQSLDAVFVILGYDQQGRPRYPQVAVDAMQAGVHVWIEKPPAATVPAIDRIAEVASQTGRVAMVGFKKMFFQPNRKAREIIASDAFGQVTLATFQEPHGIPDEAEFATYTAGRDVPRVRHWLDHLCHPVSSMAYLLGPPTAMSYQRCSRNGAGVATFSFGPAGPVVAMHFTPGQSDNGGRDRITIVSDNNQHVVVDNNLRVWWHRGRGGGQWSFPYGATPDFYAAPPEQASVCWEPEFSLGQLYNKGIFLLGYYEEIEHFAQAVLQGRTVDHGTLAEARLITGIFEAFVQGPGKTIDLS